MASKDKFTFEISLSVLNHLGRNLYRSFITVLGEAISNSWDADARNVWIYIDKKKSSFVIKDDGIGMSHNDFQNKFLKIGYTKRASGRTVSKKGRKYIGRKGIGKLALLSCAKIVSITSKTKTGNYVGGVIDNSGLDKAIKEDLAINEYALSTPKKKIFKKYLRGHKHGTIIHFEGINEEIRSSVTFLKSTVALYFRFSLIDNSFNIYINDEKITYDHLDPLAKKTEFLWNINNLKDPYITRKLEPILKMSKKIKLKSKVKGFVASVEKPRNLSIFSTGERVSIDLFVNGRLRERDIMKHIPTSRVVENYLYGQIHFDELDDKIDRFTSSREGIVASDTKYKKFLEDFLKNVMRTIIEEWDVLRLKFNKDGDSENKRLSTKERKGKELFNATAEDFKFKGKSKYAKKAEKWVSELGEDAQYNFPSYSDCYLSENLIRKYIQDKKIKLSPNAKNEIKKYKKNEAQFKKKAGISISTRKRNVDLSFLSMDDLSNLVDKKDPLKEACLSRDAIQYKPMRDALMHTALLTDEAKKKLSSVYDNIKGRVRNLLSGKS